MNGLATKFEKSRKHMENKVLGIEKNEETKPFCFRDAAKVEKK